MWKRIGEVVVLGGGGECTDSCERLLKASLWERKDERCIPCGFGDVSMVCRSFMLLISYR